MQFYCDPEREQDAHALPDAETFHSDAVFHASRMPENLERGWYWWACFPGCLPDGPPSGPFGTEALAIIDARESVGAA